MAIVPVIGHPAFTNSWGHLLILTPGPSDVMKLSIMARAQLKASDFNRSDLTVQIWLNCCICIYRSIPKPEYDSGCQLSSAFSGANVTELARVKTF